MQATELLRELRKENIIVRLKGDGNIAVTAPKGAVTADIAQQIKSQKPEIVAFLQAAESLKTANAFSPIIPVPRTPPLPLSLQQERFWFLDKLEPNSATYSLFEAFRLTGTLDLPVFERCINEILRRHEVLRTVFEADASDPQQVIKPYQPMTLPVINLMALDEAEREAEVLRLLEAEANRPFDFTQDMMLRVKIVRLTENEQILFRCMHHIASDGWSLNLFSQELLALYHAYLHDKPSPLPDLPIQYADYAVWQQSFLQSDAVKAQLAYWQKHLGGELPIVEIPTDFPRPKARTFNGKQYVLTLTPELSRAIKALSQQQGTTLFMTLLAAFKLLVSRHTGQEDVIVGSPITGRDKTHLDLLIGCFLNTLVLRSDLSGEIDFIELLKRIQQVCVDAYKNQDIPFEDLLKELHPPRDLSRTPLFQIFFNMLPKRDVEENLPGIIKKEPIFSEGDSNFDVTLYVDDEDHQISLIWVYNSDLYADDHMVELATQYQTLLAQVAENPNKSLTSYSLVTESTQAVIPNAAERLAFTWQGAVHTRVSKHAQLSPHQLAVIDCLDSWTYEDLEQQSNQLAHYLIDAGLQPQDVVAVVAHRSASLVWALLAVQKAGCAFVLLDPAYPDARLVAYLEQSQPRALIQLATAVSLPEAVQAWSAEHVLACQIELPRLADVAQWDKLDSYSVEAPDVVVAPDDLAYIAFTSGSTGQPKGIMGSHRPITHFLEWHTNTFDLKASDRFSMLSGLAHDPLLRDVFTPLFVGGTLCIPTQEDMFQPGRLAVWLAQESVGVVHLTPAMGQLLTINGNYRESLDSLRYAFFGGDVLSEQLTETLRTMAPHLTCVNFYGATETPQAMAYYEMPAASICKFEVPLGHGIADVQLLVLNENARSTGIGELGEIHIRTPYLSLGYLNDDALTAARFLTNPVTELKDDRLYKTGDLGRYLLDGSVQFVGRTDQQVKIRGFRIELGEIEAVLLRHEAVVETAVILREDLRGEKRLVAYVVAQHEIPLDALRNLLKQKLPDYMQPSAFVFLDELPLTPNGKIAKTALPKPDYSEAQRETQFTEAQTELEAQLVDIWQQVLKVKPIGIHDNFFHLGGHSLMALRLFAKLEETTGHVLPLTTLFEAPTIAELAARMTDTESEAQEWSVLAPIQPKGDQPPFFYVAPYSISVLQFNDIGSHFRERPFYGIQPLGFNEDEEIHTTIEEMAAHYIEAIQSVQPHGPYYLGGHCAGAWVAYEIALQLEQLGESIGYLAIVDSPAPNYLEPGQGTLSYMVNRMNYYAKDRRLIHALGWKLKLQAEKKLLYRHGTPQIQRIQTVRNIHDQAFDNYNMRSGYTGPMTILRSSDNINIFATDGWYKNWLAFTPQTVEIVDIHSTHAMLIFNPQAEELAHHFLAGIEQGERLVSDTP